MASITNPDTLCTGSAGSNGTSVNPFLLMDSELQAIHEQIDQAHNLKDIQVVIERLKNWVVANSHYRELTYLVFEQLYRREEGAKEAVAEAARMGLSTAEQEQRERLSQLRLSVHAEDAPQTFRAALGDARQALKEWKSVHPDDPLIPLLKNI